MVPFLYFLSGTSIVRQNTKAFCIAISLIY